MEALIVTQSTAQFVETNDGVNIAYCIHGGGPPLIYVRGWISHLEMLWEIPRFRAFFEPLAQHYQLVRYDTRGNGLSDHEAPEVSLDALVTDLEALIDGLGLNGVTILGSTFGGVVSMAYAAKHPKKVSRLILDGTFARGSDLATPDEKETLLRMLRAMPEAAFHTLSLATTPEQPGPPRSVSNAVRRSISAEMAYQMYSMAFDWDVTPLLPQVKAPTLVLHRKDSRSVKVDLGRRVAARIPGARFIALNGSAQNIWDGDARQALSAIGEFLGVELALAPEPVKTTAAPVTIFFTDMEASTAITQKIGDLKAQEVLRIHNQVVRQAVGAHQGSEIKHTGDGIMASFASASQAIEAAIDVQRALAAAPATSEHRLRVRIGLNAGEPISEEQDLYGTAVQLATRVMDEAKPGEIMVANVVRELVAGKGFKFEDRGLCQLKGFAEPVRIFAVRWSD